MRLKELEKAVKKYAKYVVQQSRTNLSKKGKRLTGKLYDSLEPEFEYDNNNNFFVRFKMADYGAFQDQGVKGTQSSYSESSKSPFKFGTGTGKRGGLTKGIENWIKLKKFQFRDSRGRFMSYKSMQYIIVNSIWRKGLRATLFFSNPFEKGIQRFGDDFLNAYLLDVERNVILGVKK